VLLSATPMKDNITEFASVMNLILPINMQLPTKKDFNKTFFDNLDKIKNTKMLKEYIRGRISFLRSMESQITKINVGKLVKNLKYTLVESDKMSDFQSEVYEKALRKDGSIEDIEVLKNDDGSGYSYLTERTENNLIKKDLNENEDETFEEISDEEHSDVHEDKGGLYDNSRQASLFVFPNGKYGKDGFDDPDNIEYISKTSEDELKGKKPIFTKKLKNILTQNGKLTSPMDILNEIGKYSSKQVLLFFQNY